MIINCEVCGKEVSVFPSHFKRGGRYCSAECADIAHSNRMSKNGNPKWKGGLLKRNCLVCGEEFYVKRFRVRDGYGIYCSQKCCKSQHGKKISKEKCYLWKGGITPLVYQFRLSNNSKKWKIEVFRRDNFSCVICGNNKGGNLEAHHKISVSKLFEIFNPQTFEEILNIPEFWDINNGVTLCSKCHHKLHSDKD